MTAAYHRPLKPRDRFDKGVLMGAFAIGFVGILAMKLHFAVSHVWIAAFAAVVLTGYVAATSFFGQLAIEPESIGDNAYYLGFLFTLVSLSATLYQLAMAPEQIGALRDVIAGFGIALSSTMVGVLLRILLIQIRPDVVTRDREARAELHQAARILRAELTSSAAAMKQFTVEATQMKAEQSARITSLTDEIVAAQRERAKQDAEIYAEVLTCVLEQAVRRITDQLAAAAAESTRMASEEIMSAMTMLSESVARYADAERQAIEERQASDRASEQREQAALERSAELAGGIETLAARMSAALKILTGDLGDGVDALMVAREKLASATRSAPDEEPPRGGLFAGWR